MKLKEAIDMSDKDILDKLFKDCYSFIKESEAMPLWRGINTYGEFIEEPVRIDRTPLTGLVTFFNYINNKMKKTGFKAIRSNSIICTGNNFVASTYGTLYRIFPIGEYFYTWNPKIDDYIVQSWTDQDVNLKADTEHKNTSEKKKQEIADAAIKFWKKFGSDYENNQLVDAIKSENEILLTCKKFYGLKIALAEQLNDKIKEMIS